ncbi:MAG: diguanylate cyclase [Planctomycetes bacterium]|nr:diguanylate cyclase [Planctomycetota bacterium]
MKKSFDELKLTGNLPSPAGVGMKILTLTQKEDFSADDIAKTIQTDPALTGRIIKMANSAASAGVKVITNVNDAVVRLGARTVRNVALGFSLISAYRQGGCKSFDYQRYWTESLARAVACQTISARKRMGAPSDAYICGLLSGIGRLALACVHPQAYADVLAQTSPRTNDLELARVEQQASTWTIANSAPRCCGTGICPTRTRTRSRTFAASPADDPANSDRVATMLRLLLRVSSSIAQLLLDDAANRPALWSQVEVWAKEVQMSTQEFIATCDQIAREWQDWGKTLAIRTSKVDPFTEIAARAAEASQPAAPEIALAADAPTTPDESDGTPASNAAAIEPLTILAIDDDPVCLKLLLTHLKRTGHNLISAPNGKAGLQAALEHGPHVIITDWMMPEMDGLELVKQIRRIELGKDIHILMLTGREEEDRVVEAFEAGVDDVVTKPFNPRILLSRVSSGERIVRLREQVSTDRRKMEDQVAELAILNRRLNNSSNTDALTQVANRRYGVAELEDQWNKTTSLAVIMLDLDHFKRVNDSFGHDAGDQVLREAAKILGANVRKSDTVCRMGGEEFMVILPDTSPDEAKIVAERLRNALAAHVIQHGSFEGHVTASLGVAVRTGNMEHSTALYKAADEAVYASKQAGRNRVTFAA